MKKKFIRETLSLILTLCMSISLCSVSAFANPDIQNDEILVSENEDTIQDIQEITPSVSDDTDNVDSETSEDVDANIEESQEEPVISEEGEAEEITVEEEITDQEMATGEEDSEFEETGIFGLTVTDRNGSKVNAWYDTSANVYYLFLTNAVTISEMELQVTGIKMKRTSAGTLNPTTNVITGAFSKTGDGITLTAEDGNKYNVVVKQSGIPSLSITLNGTSRSTIDSGSKNTKYAGQTVLITDASGNVNVSQSDVEIKGRGNTTWDYSEKKPYQIKFAKKQSVLGMAKAKKWVLLASAFDDSMLRNKVAFYLGDAMNMTYSPDLEFVDLWIDGEYRGTYSIGEKCEIDSNRLNLTDSLGALVEYDNFFYRQEDYWYEDTTIGTHFALAESVDENNGQGALNNFRAKVNAFTSYAYNTSPSNYTLDALSKYISLEDFAKWYLCNEYLSNVESYSTSWFWYCDGASDVLHLGPNWDFDTTQGIHPSLSGSTLMYGKQYNGIFRRLMSSPAFAGYVKKVYTQYRSVFSSLSGCVTTWGNQLSSAADGNYTRWKWLGGKNLKGKAFASTYSGALADLKNWLISRDSGFGISVPAAPSANTSVTVSESGRYMTVKATDVTGCSSLSVAIWSNTNGQDDLKWYSLSKNTDGSMSVTVDLKNHGSSDTYYAHVYGGGSFLGGHTEKVNMVVKKPVVTAEYKAETGQIQILVKDISDYDFLSAAIWTSENGQDDLTWYQKNVNAKNELSYLIDSSSLKHIGMVNVHIYGTIASKQSFLCKTTVEITDAGEPEITAVQTDGGSVLDITTKNMAGYSKVTAAVWGNVNGQDDLKWYAMTKNDDGSWTYGVDLTTHNETGNYFVHIYATKAGTSSFVGGTQVLITEPAAPSLAVKTISQGVSFRASLKNSSALDSVSFAVWGNVSGQNDLKWYSAKKNASGVWVADIPLDNHREYGIYNIHAYGIKAGKQSFQASANYTVDELKCAYLELTASSSGKTLITSLVNAADYSSISLAVWGNTNGQNDLKWYSAKRNLDGSFSISIDLTAHNETGVYNVHAYGVKNGKSTFITSATQKIDSFGKVAVTATAKGNSFQIKAANTDDYSKMTFAVWTSENGQDDLVWYTAAKYSDCSYRYTPSLAAHGGNGTYNIHAYGTKDGKQSYIGSCTFVKSDLAKPSVEAALKKDGTKLVITVNDTIGYTTVSAAVWGSENGQNDLKWYSMKKAEDGTLTVTVDLSAHNEKGTYYIHVYGVYNKKQYYMNGCTAVVA